MPKSCSLQVACLLLICAVAGFDAIAAPRILRSNTPGSSALWLNLKKEAQGHFLLHLSREGTSSAESFKLTADTAAQGNVTLRFDPGEEARAMASLKDVEDVITHSTTNNADAAGDASGDINSFVNDVLLKDGSEGVIILPSVTAAADSEPATKSGGWLWMIGGLLIGAAGGIAAMRTLNAGKAAVVLENENEPMQQELAVKPEDAPAAAAQAVLKLKKAQKDLKDSRAQLAQMTKVADSERAKNAAQDEDYKALEARLKTGDSALTGMQTKLAEAQKELLVLRNKTAQQDAYFKSAADTIIKPFTDYVSGSRINPADPSSQAIVAEQVLMMGIQYFSLVRYGAGIWDEHDIYNVQQLGGLGAGQKGSVPQAVSTDIKSGAPNLVLSIAALLRQAGASGAAMEVSIRGYRLGTGVV